MNLVEDLLSHVLGLGAMAQQPERESENQIEVVLEEDGEGFGIPRANPLEDRPRRDRRATPWRGAGTRTRAGIPGYGRVRRMCRTGGVGQYAFGGRGRRNTNAGIEIPA
jgi:hypothetical protein